MADHGREALFPPIGGRRTVNLQVPVVEYGRGEGCSITGGAVYRGSQFSRFRGLFLYGDWCSGTIWGLDLGTGATRVLAHTDYSVVGFGEDSAGELYVVDFNGRVGRITEVRSPRRRVVIR